MSSPSGGSPTGVPRVISALFCTDAGAMAALFVPLQTLVGWQFVHAAGHGAGLAVAVINGFGALLVLAVNLHAGRAGARFGRRRTGIFAGAVAVSLAVFAQVLTAGTWAVAVVWWVVQTLLNLQLAASGALLADRVPAYWRGVLAGFAGCAAAAGWLVGISVGRGSWPAGQWGLIAGLGTTFGAVAVVLLRDSRRRRAAGPAEPDRVTSPAQRRAQRALGWVWLLRVLITCAYAGGAYDALVARGLGVAGEGTGGVVLVMSALAVAPLVTTGAVAGLPLGRIRRHQLFVIPTVVAAAGAIGPVADAYVAVAVLVAGMGLLVSIDTVMCVGALVGNDHLAAELGITKPAGTLPWPALPLVVPFLVGLGGSSALNGTLAVLAIGRRPHAAAPCPGAVPGLRPGARPATSRRSAGV